MSFLLKNTASSGWQPHDLKVVTGDKYKTFSTEFRNEFQEQILSCLNFELHQNVVVIGIRDLDLIVDLHKRLSDESNLILIELVDGDEVAVEGNITDFYVLYKSEKVKLFIGTRVQLEELFQGFMKIRTFNYNMKNTKIITMPYLKSKMSQDVVGLFESFFEHMRSLGTLYGNSVSDILLGSDNFIINWKYYLDSLHAHDLAEKYAEIPCVIVGAGPSLDKNIDRLKEMKGHGLILAVDAALNTLLDHGIKPDVIATIERSEKTFKFYQSYDHFEDIILLAPNMIMGEILEKFDYRINTGRQQDGFVRGITAAMERSNLDIGFNSAHLPFALAKHMGCNPIVFVGMDLAYTGGRTHTDNVAHNIEGPNLYRVKENTIKVRGQNGELLDTLTFFLYAKKFFETFMLNHRETRYINATEGGANILGMENRTFSEVLEITKTSSLAEGTMLNDLIQLKESRVSEREGMSRMAKAYLNDQIRQFGIIKQNCLKAIKNLEGDRDAVMKSIRAYTELGYNSDEELRIPLFFMQSMLINYNRKLRGFPVSPSDEDLDGMKELSRNHYEEAIGVADVILGKFNSYIEIMNAHEEGKDVDIVVITVD